MNRKAPVSDCWGWHVVFLSPLQFACTRSHLCMSWRRSCWSHRGARHWTAAAPGAWTDHSGGPPTPPQSGRRHSLQRPHRRRRKRMRTPILTIPVFSNYNHTDQPPRQRWRRKQCKKKILKIRGNSSCLWWNILTSKGMGEGLAWKWKKKSGRWLRFTFYAKSPAEIVPGG